MTQDSLLLTLSLKICHKLCVGSFEDIAECLLVVKHQVNPQRLRELISIL
jgi:hypothetical protein